MLMARKKKEAEISETKAVQEQAEEPGQSEAVEAIPSTGAQSTSPAKRNTQSGSSVKMAAIAFLLIAALVLAYYFLSQSLSFASGPQVSAESFKDLFRNATNVYIVMDVRGAPDDAVQKNILQCGVDFAASNGMGGKTVTPLSFDKGGCVAPDGMHEIKDCFAMLKGGLTVYVKEGNGGATYYSNGMIVGVGPVYTLGTCSIKSG